MAIPTFGAVDTIIAGAGSGTAKLGGVLDANTTTFSSPEDTVENDAISYTLPANTLNTDGKIVRIKAWGQAATNVNVKTVRIYLRTITVNGDEVEYLVTGGVTATHGDLVVPTNGCAETRSDARRNAASAWVRAASLMKV